MSFKEIAEKLNLGDLVKEWSIYLDTAHTLLELLYPHLKEEQITEISNKVVTGYMTDGILPETPEEATKLLFSGVITQLGWPKEFKPYTKKGDARSDYQLHMRERLSRSEAREGEEGS